MEVDIFGLTVTAFGQITCVYTELIGRTGTPSLKKAQLSIDLQRVIQLNKPPIESPFLQPTQRRLSFSMILMLLLMVIGAGVAMLIYNALQVPAVTAELDAWLGRQTKVVNAADGREAQIVFILFCYSAPLMLGILVHSLHLLVNYIDRRRVDAPEDEQFRMSEE